MLVRIENQCLSVFGSDASYSTCFQKYHCFFLFSKRRIGLHPHLVSGSIPSSFEIKATFRKAAVLVAQQQAGLLENVFSLCLKGVYK